MLKNILVATDASPASNRAINLAADIAGKYGATLHLLYAVREMQLPPELKKMARKPPASERTACGPFSRSPCRWCCRA